MDCAFAVSDSTMRAFSLALMRIWHLDVVLLTPSVPSHIPASMGTFLNFDVRPFP